MNAFGRVDSASVSEIDNMNFGRQLTKQEQIIYNFNKFRFKYQPIMQRLMKIITEETNKDEKTITIKEINKTIHYKDEDILKKLKKYLKDIDSVNQILPDFTYSPTINQLFDLKYGPSIDSNNSLFQKSSPEFMKQFQETFQCQFYYGYSLEDIALDDLESVIILIIIEEFILLNSNIPDKRGNNLLIEFDSSNNPVHLGILCNNFNCINVHMSRKTISAMNSLQGGILEQASVQNINNGNNTNNVNNSQSNSASNNINSGNGNKFNVYILLMYTDILENHEQGTPIKSMRSHIRKTAEGKNVYFSVQSQGQNSSTKKNRENQAIIPQKYSKPIHKTTIIPKLSIENMVKQMDSNNDGKIEADDIKKFSKKHFISWDDTVYTNMFKEAASKRIVAFPEQYESPLTIDEIWMAGILISVDFIQKINEKKLWVELERPFRKQWIMLLQEAGEVLPEKHDLPKIQIQAIKDFHQLNIETYKPQINKAKSSVFIKPIQPKQYIKPFRAEAGILINNTENIQEIVVDKEGYDENKIGAFEKIINSRFKLNDNAMPTIKFDTMQYFKEADRLSKQPQSYIKAPKNPIYQFVPENFNFQIQQKDQLQGNNETMQHLQQKKLQSLRASKAFSSNILIGNEQDSISQFKDLEEMEEIDAESLMRTQSVPINTLRQTKVGINTQKICMDKVQSLPNLQIPVEERNKIREENLINRMKQSLSPQNTQNIRSGNNLFTTTFKLENCNTLKMKLASQEPVTDPYNPVSYFTFRDLVPPEKKLPFKNRFKPDPLINPHGMSEHDSRPKEALEREQKMNYKKEEEEIKKIDEYQGKSMQAKLWAQYIPVSDKYHNVGDQKRPQYYNKGIYEEPTNILHNLLRGESHFVSNFKLFHRPLHSQDKNLSLGENPDSKF